MMKLKEIRLRNFRCYEDLTVPLHENLTVLVAPNGQGKTAILDAISIALKTYLRGFDLANHWQRDAIIVDDIRIIQDKKQHHLTMVRQLPTEIIAINHENLSWRRYRNTENANELNEEFQNTLEDSGAEFLYQSSKIIQEKIRDINLTPISLPMIAYYGTNRGLGRSDTFATSLLNLTFDSDVHEDDRSIRTFAYYKCLDSESDYRELRKWFNRISIDILNSIADSISRNINFSNEDLKKLDIPISAITTPINKVLEMVKWKNPRIIFLNNISLEHEEYGRLKLNQLSDGIRNVFGLVADIAYRCYLLNSHLGENAAKETEGIVLIDEVDMHLHPEWQQVILRDLQAAFPNLQFIVTTHSPQVLSTVKKEHIRIIRDGNLEEVLSNTYGEISGDVMYRVQGVNPRPPIKEREDLDKLMLWVDSGRYDDDEVNSLLNQLIDKLGSENEAIIRIQRSIKRQQILANLK